MIAISSSRYLDELLAKLPARRIDVVAARVSKMRHNAATAQDRDESNQPIARGSYIDCAAQAGADGVVGNEIDVRPESFQQIGQLYRLVIRIIDAGHHAPLDS